MDLTLSRFGVGALGVARDINRSLVYPRPLLVPDGADARVLGGGGGTRLGSDRWSMEANRLTQRRKSPVRGEMSCPCLSDGSCRVR